MLRKLLLLIALVLLALPVIAQDGPTGEIVIALSNDPTSLYPPRGADITAGNAAGPLYDSLVFKTIDNEMLPSLAESWTVSEDGTAWTFTLRQGVTFHNGEAFTADDVLATWEFGSDEANDYAGSYTLVSGVEVVDDYTVTLTTAEPNPLFLTRVAAGWSITPGDYMREVGIEGFELAPVGTGPFRFVERTAGDRIVYEANPDYWQDGQPKLARVTFRVIPDSTTRLAAIQTGEIDIANRLSIDEIRTLEGMSGVEVVSYPNDRVYYVAFKNVGNGVDTPLEDVRVRQAMNYAVNREGIIQALFGGEANLISGFILPFNLGYDESIQPYPYDPDQARALLAEAGFGEGFEITLGCPTDAYLNINEVCLSVQRDLNAVGIEASVEFKSSNAYWAEPQYANTGPMYVDSWSSDLGEAINRLEGALVPGSYYAGWEDPQMVEYMEQINTTIDAEARAAIYSEVQRYMYDNPMFIYLYAPNIFEAISSRVEGYQPYPNEGYFLNNVSVSG